MKIKSTLTALAAGIGLMAVAGTASAINLGEVWVADQAEGEVLIYKQSKLNSKWATATPTEILHRHDDLADSRLHLIGFNNRKGVSSKSRAHLAYLNGRFEVWTTNVFGSPSLVFTDVQAASTAASLHMCGGSPDNSKIGCSSIGGSAIVMYSSNDSINSYVNEGTFPLSTMPISASAPAGTAAEYATISGSKPICNNFDTSSNYLYVTINTGGLAILDVSDVTNPEVINAYGPGVIPATGCGLVNSPDGKSMWTNSGSNNNADDERAFNWKFSNIGTSNGPTVVDIPEIDHGDVHGAQFAGPGVYLWEIMRLDNVIHVINSYTKSLVNTFSVATSSLGDPAGDVLDRSALGGNMYTTLRGFVPITAITAFPNLDRDPGVMTIKSRWFGYTGKVKKVTSIRSLHGNTTLVCPEDDGDDHTHSGSDCLDEFDNQIPGTSVVDNADPHGLKSLNYLTGGF